MPRSEITLPKSVVRSQPERIASLRLLFSDSVTQVSFGTVRKSLSRCHDAHRIAPRALARAAAQRVDLDQIRFARRCWREQHPACTRVIDVRVRPRRSVVQAELQLIYPAVEHRAAAHRQLSAHTVVNAYDLRRVQRAGRAVVAHHLVAGSEQRVQVMPRRALAIERVLHQRIQQRLTRDAFGERAILAELARGGHVRGERAFQRGQQRGSHRRRVKNRMARQCGGHVQRQVAHVVVRRSGEPDVDAEVSYRCIADYRWHNDPFSLMVDYREASMGRPVISWKFLEK